jgi:outer membrane murein-binding lipoprotein Lpp
MPTVKIRLAPSAAAICAAFALCVLSGCASDETTARFLVAPGKYVLYTCDELARQAQALAARQKELEQLMAKAGTDATGRMMGEAAYRSEYIAVRGEITELRKTAAEKSCNPLPGPDNPTGRASDGVIR